MGGRAVAGEGFHVGRLAFRPNAAPRKSGREAVRSGYLELRGDRSAAPASGYVPDTDGPLQAVIVLHGAGGQAPRTLRLLQRFADDQHLLLVAPQSRQPTWDVIAGGYGPDVRNIDQLMTKVADDYPITGWSVSGFSDGASYALSLGITNGDVFESVAAFSPGFEAAQVEHGHPRFFVSHGVDDRVLPIERCSRRLVPELRARGYQVQYTEFDGGHEVPPEMAEEAARWLAARDGSA